MCISLIVRVKEAKEAKGAKVA